MNSETSKTVERHVIKESRHPTGVTSPYGPVVQPTQDIEMSSGGITKQYVQGIDGFMDGSENNPQNLIKKLGNADVSFRFLQVDVYKSLGKDFETIIDNLNKVKLVVDKIDPASTVQPDYTQQIKQINDNLELIIKNQKNFEKLQEGLEKLDLNTLYKMVEAIARKQGIDNPYKPEPLNTDFIPD